jgi:hypothetical protein
VGIAAIVGNEDAVRETTRTMARNAAHLAGLLRAQNYPVD